MKQVSLQEYLNKRLNALGEDTKRLVYNDEASIAYMKQLWTNQYFRAHLRRLVELSEWASNKVDCSKLGSQPETEKFWELNSLIRLLKGE
ncbi:hypothetical protein DRH27_04715 [Candidatus Falkowbacteria bacterium]|nr:MAG: hypothetical protein DRH27_04715 [Candidatus Falkowbacteria bacterium]